jgi:MFS family permease
LASAAIGRFLAVYAIRLGASSGELGLMASLPGITMLLATFLSVRWRSRYTTSVEAQVWPSLGSRLLFLLPILTPFFPAPWQPVWLIVSVAVPALPRGIADSITLSLLRESVSEARMTALLSRRQMTLNFAFAAGSLVCGYWLEAIHFPRNYQIMFGAAFLASLMSFWHINQTRPLRVIGSSGVTAPANPWRESRFLRLAVILVAVHLAFFSVTPLIPLRLVDELGAEEGFIAIFGMSELAGGTLAAALTVRMVPRLGNKLMLALAMLGTALGVTLVALAPSLTVALIAAVISGASWTVADIGQFGFFSESMPVEGSTRYTTAYLQLLSLALFLGSMIGSTLNSWGVALVPVLLLGAGLRMAAGIFTWKWRPFEHRSDSAG